MRAVSRLMTLIFVLQAHPALARPFACAVLDASASAGTSIAEICISHDLVVMKPRSRISENFYYRPKFIGPFMSVREYELEPLSFQGAPKGSSMRFILEPARGNRNEHLVLSTIGSRVTLIGSPKAPVGQHDVRGFVQKELLLY